MITGEEYINVVELSANWFSIKGGVFASIVRYLGFKKLNECKYKLNH